MGHLQRMLTLAAVIIDRDDFDLSFFLNDRDALPPEFKDRAIESLPDKCDLIIRDMRDSSAEEIEKLKIIAPTLVIDDTGEGRALSDYVIDLLPNPGHKVSSSFYREDFFLYGFNFTKGLKGAVRKVKEKFIDIALYTGLETPGYITENLKNILPRNARVLHLTGGTPINFFSGEPADETLSYPEILLGTKVLITHFGITLFEGSLCGCSLFTYNPSDYHRELTGLIKNQLDITDLGLYSSEIPDSALHILEREIQKSSNFIIEEENIIRRASAGAEKFYEYIKSLLPS